MVQINWLPASKKDLKDIFNFISKDSIKYATFQVNKLKATADALAIYPELGKNLRDVKNSSIREIVEGSIELFIELKRLTE